MSGVARSVPEPPEPLPPYDKPKYTPSEARAPLEAGEVMSDGEAALLFQLRAAGLPAPETQYRFAPPRKWASDFCWPAKRLIVEVDGGIWSKSGHTSGKAYTNDRERDAEALCQGWRVLRVTTGQVESGQALAWIERALR